MDQTSAAVLNLLLRLLDRLDLLDNAGKCWTRWTHWTGWTMLDMLDSSGKCWTQGSDPQLIAQWPPGPADALVSVVTAHGSVCVAWTISKLADIPCLSLKSNSFYTELVFSWRSCSQQTQGCCVLVLQSVRPGHTTHTASTRAGRNFCQ